MKLEEVLGKVIEGYNLFIRRSSWHDSECLATEKIDESTRFELEEYRADDWEFYHEGFKGIQGGWDIVYPYLIFCKTCERPIDIREDCERIKKEWPEHVCGCQSTDGPKENASGSCDPGSPCAICTEKGTFSWALYCMKNGIRVKRKGWDDDDVGTYLKLDKSRNAFLFHYIGETTNISRFYDYCFSYKDLLATDWEVFDINKI